MISVFTHTHEGMDSPIKCTYIDVGRFRVLIALSGTRWYTAGKKRDFPIYFKRNELFAWRLAIKVGKRREGAE